MKIAAIECFTEGIIMSDNDNRWADGDIALLTVRGNVEYDFVSIKKYERRKDLLDPTEFLEKIDS